MKKTVIVIPARYGSSRLNGKPLLEVCSKPIIQWVWEKAIQIKDVDDVIIATDNNLIFEACKAFKANVEMTKTSHKSGSDRIAEVISRRDDFEYIINLQGDEPLINPKAIELLINSVKNNDKADISTLVRPIENISEYENPNVVKCVLNKYNYAMYFSRATIPYFRNKNNDIPIYAHIGLYGYKRKSLLNLTGLPQANCEIAESLEQLRALYNGMNIKVELFNEVSIGIDTQEDFDNFKNLMESKINN